jgi:hypothetical protein
LENVLIYPDSIRLRIKNAQKLLNAHDALHLSSRIEKHDELTLYHTRPRADNGTRSKFQVHILSRTVFTAPLTFIVNEKHISGTLHTIDDTLAINTSSSAPRDYVRANLRLWYWRRTKPERPVSVCSLGTSFNLSTSASKRRHAIARHNMT